jgi:hypothetical protein
MSGRIITGSLLLLGAFFAGYHAYHGLTDWQNRNRAAFGETNLLPYFEIALSLLMGVAGFWLLFKKPSN